MTQKKAWMEAPCPWWLLFAAPYLRIVTPPGAFSDVYLIMSVYNAYCLHACDIILVGKHFLEPRTALLTTKFKTDIVHLHDKAVLGGARHP